MRRCRRRTLLDRATFHRLIEVSGAPQGISPINKCGNTEAFSTGFVFLGEKADCSYIVESGEVRIMIKGKMKVNQQDGAEEVEVVRCSRGQYFGELSLVTNKRRAASVNAVGETKCLVFDIQAFECLLVSCVDIMKRNMSQYEDPLVALFGSSVDLKP